MDSHLAAVVFLPEYRLLTLSGFVDGRPLRVAVGNSVLALLTGRPVESESDQVEAFERGRSRLVAIVAELLEQGRGGGGGLHVTPEDVSATVCQPLTH